MFTAECCMQCVNPSCTRSTFGTSKFEIRTATWHDRLFTKVPRMDPSDPRFMGISAKQFLAFNQPLTVSGDWVDPRDLQQSLQQSPVSAPEPVASPAPEPALVPEPAPEAPPIPVPTVPASSGTLSPHLAQVNTPVQRGQMLQPPVGAPKPTSSWDAAIPTTDTAGVQIVKAGAKVKIGG